MEEALINLGKLSYKNEVTNENDSKYVADNINEAINYPSFFGLGLKTIKRILKKCDQINTDTAKLLIKGCKEHFGEEVVLVLDSIPISDKDDDIIEILETIEWIPIIKESKNLILRLKEKIVQNEDEDGMFDVDWEPMFNELKIEKEKADLEIEELKQKLKNSREKNKSKNEDSNIKEKYEKLDRACRLGSLKDVKSIDLCKSDVNHRGADGWTPLMYSSYFGYADIAEYLISQGADVDQKNDDGATPLMIACRAGQDRVVELLLSKGANPNERDNDGWTPLKYANHHGYKSISRVLKRHQKKKP